MYPYIHTYICTNIHTYIYTYVHVHTYICTYIHTYIPSLRLRLGSPPEPRTAAPPPSNYLSDSSGGAQCLRIIHTYIMYVCMYICMYV